MVGTNQLALEMLARCAVYDIAIDLAVAIHHAVLACEVFIFGMNMERVGLLLCGPQFAAQVLVVCPEAQLIGVLRVVSETVVDVVIRDAGARAEGNLSSKVGKEVKSIVVVVLRDGQFAVQHKPVDEVRQLTHATADALRGFALGYGQSLLVSLALGGASDEFPHRERLAGTNQQPVDVLDRQSQVRSLILLQLHVHIAQPPAYERTMLIDDHGQRLLRPLPGERRPSQHVLNATLQDSLLHRQPIGEGRYLAKQLSFHIPSG